MKTRVSPDSRFRVVLSRDIREAAGLQPGDALIVCVSPGRIVMEIDRAARRIVRKGKLKVWTGEVPPMPLEDAVEQSRRYFR